MKIATIEVNNAAHVAIHVGGEWRDATAALGVQSTTEVIGREAWTQALCDEIAAAGDAYVLEAPLHFLLPYQPGKIIAIGRNYADHVAEFDNNMPEEPIFFAKSVTALLPPEEPIVIQEWYGRTDHEGELGVVVGKTCKDTADEQAREAVAGYTLVNDVTARTMQKRDMGQGNPWFRSKNLDTFCPIGPVVTLPGALPWPVEVDIQVRVNGETRQAGNTKQFIFKIPQLIAAVSKHMTLHPGDLISTGTPAGVSPLGHGDVVEVTIPEIGCLRNPVIQR